LECQEQSIAGKLGGNIMKSIKLNNVIFPIWAMMILPPIMFIVLGGNYIIDSAVILISFWALKGKKLTKTSTKEFYKNSIIRVWILGFLADIIGSIPLWGISMTSHMGFSQQFVQAIHVNPFSHLGAFFMVLASIIIAIYFIYVFNYKISFKKVEERALKMKMSLILAIITAPWTFLIPTQWFYKGF